MGVHGRVSALRHALSLQTTLESTAARKLVASHVPARAVADKHHWMLVTVPEHPVAGEELVIYFNRNASDALRWALAGRD